MTEASKPSTNSTPGLQMAVSLSAVTQPSTSDSEALSFRELIPIPTKLEPNSNQSSRKRRVGHACVITASPHKRMLVEAREQQKESIQKKEERKAKLMQKKLEAKSKKVGKAKETNRRPREKENRMCAPKTVSAIQMQPLTSLTARAYTVVASTVSHQKILLRATVESGHILGVPT